MCVIVELKGANITDFVETFHRISSPYVSSLCSVKHSEVASLLKVFEIQLVFLLESAISS